MYDIAWQSKDDVARLPLTFPEDRPFLLSLFPKKKVTSSRHDHPFTYKFNGYSRLDVDK